MSTRDSPVTTDELHAYVDGVLPPDRHAAVEAWIASHPDDAVRVAEWRAQAETIRLRYGAIADEPVPHRLDLAKLAHGRPPWRAVAASALIAAAVGGLAGWMLHGASAATPDILDIITAEAVNAHRLYIGEARHPIEVRANEKHLLPWLSKRVGTSLKAPDLKEYSLKLLGGRLLPGPIGPAALFMYEGPSGERITVYSSRTKSPRSELRYKPRGEVAAVRWVENGIGFVISGPADRDRLSRIAESAYEQMDNAAGRSAGLRTLPQLAGVR